MGNSDRHEERRSARFPDVSSSSLLFPQDSLVFRWARRCSRRIPRCSIGLAGVPAGFPGVLSGSPVFTSDSLGFCWVRWCSPQFSGIPSGLPVGCVKAGAGTGRDFPGKRGWSEKRWRKGARRSVCGPEYGNRWPRRHELVGSSRRLPDRRWCGRLGGCGRGHGRTAPGCPPHV